MSRLGALAPELLVWGGLALAPLVVGAWQVSELAQFLTYGIFAMSLALIWGQCGLLSFGHAVFFGVGAYAMSLTTLGMVPGAGDSTPAGLALAMAAPAAVANLLGRFLFYGRGLRGAYFGIVMLAIAVVAERLATNWDYAGGLNGLMGVPPLRVAGVELFDPLPLFYVTLAVALAIYAGLEHLVRAPWGSVLRAIRGNEERTAALGYDTAACKLAAFTLSAAVAGLAGALFVGQLGFASPPLIGFALSTEVLIWVALGGRFSLLAAFLGALAVHSAEAPLAEWLGPYWLLALGLAFVLCVTLLPRGLAGTALAWAGRR